MSLAGKLRLRRKNDVWIKGSSAIAALAIMWLVAILVMPVVIATATLGEGRPATPASAFDTGTLIVLLVGIGLLVLPRYRNKLSGFRFRWARLTQQTSFRTSWHSADVRNA